MHKFQAINIFKSKELCLFTFASSSSSPGINVAIGRNKFGNNLILNTFMNYPYTVQYSWWLHDHDKEGSHAIIFAPRTMTTFVQRIEAVNWIDKRALKAVPSIMIAKLTDVQPSKHSVMINNYKVIGEKEWYRILL